MSAPYTGTGLLESMDSAVNYNRFIADLIEKHSRGDTVLDFGAGNGTFARLLQKRGHTVSCLEPDAELRSRLQDDGFKTYDSLSNTTDHFDTIYSINVLEHIENDREAVATILNALKPHGIFIAYVPAFMALYSSVDKKIGHHRRYTLENFRPLFSGFTILRCEYADSLGFLAGLAFKTLDRGDGHVSEKAIRYYDQFAFPISKMLDVGFRHLFGKNVLIVAQKQ